jgi:hypothetical protein
MPISRNINLKIKESVSLNPPPPLGLVLFLKTLMHASVELLIRSQMPNPFFFATPPQNTKDPFPYPSIIQYRPNQAGVKIQCNACAN